MTVRERIQSYQEEILKGDLLPQRAADILTEIAALTGNISEEITTRDMEYNKHLLACLDAEKSANKAKIVAGTSEEYKKMREAHNTKDLATAMIQSLKYLLKVKEDEVRASKYQ